MKTQSLASINGCKYYNDWNAFELEGVVVTALGIKRESTWICHTTSCGDEVSDVKARIL
jgi:hypothetical protein